MADFRTCLICATWIAVAAAAVSDAADPEDARAEIDRRYADDLEALAAKCDTLGLDQQARQTREWLIDRDPQRQYLFLPDVPDPTKPSAAAPGAVRFWYRHFCTARDKHAADLFELAKQRLEQHQPTAAYQLLHEVLRDSPDHEEARRILGYRKHLGRWRRGSDRVASRTATVRHPLFGWPPRRYWRVETDHFEITTNHSVAQAKQLGEQLELLYDVWRQVFYPIWAGERDLAAAFADSRRPARPAKKHRVVLFRDRDEYVTQLKKHVPGIEVSLGYYTPDRQTSYFYAGNEQTVVTWLHEVTHQLFAELAPGVPDVGEKSNFWIIEGVAMYMESLLERDGYVTLGGFDAPRMQHARFRALSLQDYVPLADLIKMGRDDMQKDERVRALYSQSGGLAHFLMDYESGRFRDAAVAYLQLVYAGRDRTDTLEHLAGVPLAELDKLYVQFLDATDEQLARYLRPPERLTTLLLGHTSITDASLEELSAATNLHWLDLTGTRVTDQGVQHLSGAAKLAELNLEATRITDKSLRLLGSFKQLKELDLSRTVITDDGLKALAALTNLKKLWLTGTAVTDTGLEHLGALKQLEMLETSHTKVTAAGRERLRQALPKLED